MKKLMLALVLLTVAVGTAQDKKEGKWNRDTAMRDMTPEQRATLQTKKLTLALDLNEKQQKEIKELMVSQAEAREQMRGMRKADKEEGKKPTSEERYAIENSKLDAQIEYQDKMKQILTAEQFENWKKMRHHRGKRTMHRKHSR